MSGVSTFICIYNLFAASAMAICQTPAGESGHVSTQSPVVIAVSGNRVAFDAQQASLEQIVKALSRELNLNILIDTPPRPALLDIKIEGSVDDVLRKVGTATDIYWTRKGKVFIGRQSFSRLETTPQLNLAEIQATAKDVVRLFEWLSPDIENKAPGELIAKLAFTMTPDQLAVLRTPGGQLKGESLSSNQLDLLHQTMTVIYLRPVVQAWKQLGYQLEHLSGSYWEMREFPTFFDKRAGVAPTNVDPKNKWWLFSWVTPVSDSLEYSADVEALSPADFAAKEEKKKP